MSNNHTHTVTRTPTNHSSLRRTMLAPVAYDESVMPALRLARSSRIARRIAVILFVSLIATIALMVFAPWQQSVTGTGSVLAYAPDERQQTIEAPIKGRIVRWGDNIFENARVTKGQTIAEIRDLDESYVGRLERQLLNSQQAVSAARQQLEANERALDAAHTIVESYQAQLKAYESVRRETIAAQDAYVTMAERKVQAEKELLSEYRAALPQLQAELERLRTLQAENNISLQKLQEVERKYAEAQAKVRRAEEYVASAESELIAKQRERTAKSEKAQVDIDYAQAMLRKAVGDVSKAESGVAKAQQELNKAEKDVLEMETKLARQQSQIVTAPFDGFVVQITPNMGTAVLKEGDPICTIVPDTTDRSVQIWLDGNDAPLVEPGRHVRLQFEGWPALQFSGWPSVAVGTFGGEVVSVDATDNGKGKFRVLIRPDEADMAWPSERFLRQGVRANGWILLDQVQLWYEVWRRLNGFPPVISMDGDADKQNKPKPPKLPK
ncbi:Hemolysin secretion protein D, chromosomal [Maioricimonas rarisocia]|uniref:Hemolysin secretion protein D, chromosomal n=1 Tax=Maioricimonas rarisocia TaxID=2528026 RepID=A0A517Z521_9PLAN|nr:HlyD family efflux transporter periplasmic adaptor subunit [Maioricimonas rarisocia]QDU37554.1 Hemolysin secretion protein D, chromosomal [Maioricimonas rarisocia]